MGSRWVLVLSSNALLLLPRARAHLAFTASLPALIAMIKKKCCLAYCCPPHSFILLFALNSLSDRTNFLCYGYFGDVIGKRVREAFFFFFPVRELMGASCKLLTVSIHIKSEACKVKSSPEVQVTPLICVLSKVHCANLHTKLHNYLRVSTTS